MAPSRADVDDETLAGLSAQSEQSVVSTVVRGKRGRLNVRPIRTIVVAFNDGEEPRENYLAGEDLWTVGTSAMGHAVSLDSGRTWTRARIPAPKGIGALRADPWLALGPAEGEVFYGFIGTDSSGPDTERRYLVVARSTDGGRTFSRVVLVDTWEPDFIAEGCGFLDRITIDADRTTGRLFATWPGKGQSMCVVTTPAFGEPWIPTRLRKCSEELAAATGHVQVGRDGETYVVSEEVNSADDTYQLCLHLRDPRDPDQEIWGVVGAFAQDSSARPGQPAFEDSQMRLPQRHSFDIAADGTLVDAFVDSVSVEREFCPPCDLTTCPPCFTSVFVDHVYVAENREGGDPDAWEYREVAPGVTENQSQPALSAEGDHFAVSYYETVTVPGRNPELTRSIRVMTGDRFPALGGDWIPFALSAEVFEPCPSAGRYFGDYIGIGLIDGDLVDQFFTAWTDARDVFLEQLEIGNTYHQHTYGAISL